MFITSRLGKSTRGNRAVTEMETASVIHQTTIQRAEAITALACSFQGRMSGRLISKRKRAGPRNRPIFLLHGMDEILGLI